MTKRVWFPYAQMKRIADPIEIVEARGCLLKTKDGRELIDAVSSWWCAIHGYNHPEINAALAEQAGRFSHVMLGGLTHEPAERLAGELVRVTPAGLNHVFYSDSGSVAVEIALKMAIQFFRNRGQREKSRFVAVRKAYHGDTAGCMAVCDPDDGMHALFDGVFPKQFFVDTPRGGIDPPTEIVAEDAAQLDTLLSQHHEQVAAFVIEPLLQAAGGFHVHSPTYLREARRICDKYGVLLIFDEVATGFGRTGTMFAAGRAGVTPDILTVGKALTGGVLGHAATLATSKVFDAFYDDDKSKAFMHGPTFMGNALACAVALKSLEIFEREGYLEKVARIEAILNERLPAVSSPRIRGIRVIGACGAIEVDEPEAYAGLQTFAAKRGVWLRPFDRNVYAMPPYVIETDQLHRVIDAIEEWFSNA